MWLQKRFHKQVLMHFDHQVHNGGFQQKLVIVGPLLGDALHIAVQDIHNRSASSLHAVGGIIVKIRDKSLSSRYCWNMFDHFLCNGRVKCV